MLVTKDIDKNVFNYIDPWGENLSYIEWVIRASYHSTIMDTLEKYIFERDMIFNLMSVVDQQVVTAAKQRQQNIDNFQETLGESRMTAQQAIDFMWK